jgi:transcriptional regulator with XRE-family HTH domain
MRNKPAAGGDRRPPGVQRLGRAVRGLRRDRGMTLTQLAEQSGLSVAFLSQVENNRAQPSPQSLSCIAKALGCNMIDVISAARAGQVVDVDRSDPATDADDRMLGRLAQVEITELRRQAGAGVDWQSHVHEAVLYVVRGSVQVTVEDGAAAARHTLNAGDRMRCGGGVAYHWQAVVDGTVVIAACVDDRAPTFGDGTGDSPTMTAPHTPSAEMAPPR